MRQTMMTAKEAGWLVCATCHKLSRPVPHSQHWRCPRCHTRLHWRTPHSLAYAWALTLAAIIMFIPANMYPITHINFFGSGQADTILSGVIELAKAGMIPIAAVVFIASIAVPLLKLVGLIILLLSVQFRWAMSVRQRTLMYRFIEWIGRWSMLDLFVIATLVALVKLGNIATIEAGIGASAFGAVVVLTMLAAHVFDPRLMWDNVALPEIAAKIEED
ncbi:paraquat-inducible protein A [Zooshikella sp. RANM57]|uniref:paraquat-inducible protein A n=1 Tax=Zooshikella sp. RANM57 TaxID=3425863 RepID=UPI003D6FD489